MIRVGLVHNRKSRRNRQGTPPRPYSSSSVELLVADPGSPEELVQAAENFAQREAGLIIVDGGDGTVREVLSALPQTYGAELPMVAVLAAGKTNVIARDVGSAGFGPRGLERLMQAAAEGRLSRTVRERSSIEVEWLDRGHRKLHGLVFGAAAFVLGTELSGRAHRRGLAHGPAVAATILSALREASDRESGDRWRRGVPMTLAVDGETVEGNRFLVLATTLHRLMLGIWPFWGDAAKPIRFLDVPHNPLPLWSVALPLLKGRPTRAMLENGFRSGTADGITIRLSSPFVLDGEIFDPGQDGIELRTGPAFRFVSR